MNNIEKLPVQIVPCPIGEAIVEVRYRTEVPPEAVFGVVYSGFSADFPRVEKLPVMQIPQAVRAVEPNLQHMPEYRLSKPPFQLMIGPRSFALAVVGEYVGWQAYSERIFTALEKLATLNLVESVSRLGLRYINVFEGDILPKLSLRVTLRDEILKATGTELTTTLPSGVFSNTLRVFSNTSVISLGRTFQGSVIDIDTHTTEDLNDFLTHPQPVINLAHEHEKRLFFSLLLPEFLDTLNPIYGDKNDSFK